MEFNLTLLGVEQVLNSLENHHKEVLKKRTVVMKKATTRILNNVKKTPPTPVLTGNLKGSYNDNVEVKNNVITGIVGTIVEYAPDVEYGTVKQRPKPHLRPSFEKNLEKNIEEFKKILTETSF